MQSTNAEIQLVVTNLMGIDSSDPKDPNAYSGSLGLIQLCTLCGKRPAKFRYGGQIRVDQDHDVCMQCFRSWLDSTLQKQKFAMEVAQ